MRHNFLLVTILCVGCFIFYHIRFNSANPKRFVEMLLHKADVEIDGGRPWDIHVYNDMLYGRILREGSLGLGQSYMDGWWDCAALDQFFFRILKADIHNSVQLSWDLIRNYIKATLINLQSKDRAFQVGQQHYDLSNKLFQHMLDPLMIYSCGYWKNADNLAQAQEDKLDLICKKLYLEPGMRVLDIGCGWGGFAYFAAKKYGVHVVGVTVSEEQAAYARAWCKDLPVVIELKDYRHIEGVFDRIVSVGMFEHVGYKNYHEFMAIAHRCLKNDGLFLLHTIGSNLTTTYGDPWIDKYIFPNGMLPSVVRIAQAIEGLFIMEDWHNFGADYDKTLMAWHKNFNNNWQVIKDEYDQRFYRMWNYYLLSCAGSFRARNIQLWQLVLSKKGVFGGYSSIR